MEHQLDFKRDEYGVLTGDVINRARDKRRTDRLGRELLAKVGDWVRISRGKDGHITELSFTGGVRLVRWDCDPRKIAMFVDTLQNMALVVNPVRRILDQNGVKDPVEIIEAILTFGYLRLDQLETLANVQSYKEEV